MTAGLETYWFGPEDGEAMWVLGGLYTWKALGAQTGGAYSLCEVRGPAGFAAPLHSHEHENEGFYVASVRSPSSWATAKPASWKVASASHRPGRLTRSGSTPPTRGLLLLITPGAVGHEGMFAEMGEPATDHVLPAPPDGPPDFAGLAAIAAKHGTTILGPPPGAGP